jgi:hypothetical protein
MTPPTLTTAAGLSDMSLGLETLVAAFRPVRVRSLRDIARELADVNLSAQLHPGRQPYASEADEDGYLALADRRLDLEAEFRAAVERETGVRADLLQGAL